MKQKTLIKFTVIVEIFKKVSSHLLRTHETLNKQKDWGFKSSENFLSTIFKKFIYLNIVRIIVEDINTRNIKIHM